MDQDLLVDSRFEDGEKLLSALVRSGFDVTVAFWVLTSEDHSWRLYIGSNAADASGYGNAFGMLYVTLAKIPHISLSLLEVKLVHPSDPIAKEALALRDRNQARLPSRYRGNRLGDLAIEEAYIYPKTGPMTRDEVLQTVMARLKNGGHAQPATITLANGNTLQAIPTGIQLGGPMGLPTLRLQIALVDPSNGQTQYVAADDVIDLQYPITASVP